MPSVQSSYSENIRAGVAGMRANQEPVVLISRNNAAAAAIGFGKVVQEAAAVGGATNDLNTVAMDADRYLGITMRERGTTAENPDGWGVGENMLIMRKGVMWVEVAGAVTKGTDVTVTLATGVLGSAAVGAGVVAIPRARWESSTSGAGLAKIRLD